MVDAANILNWGLSLIQLLLVILIFYNLIKFFGTFGGVRDAASSVGGGLGRRIRGLLGEEKETVREEKQTAKGQKLTQKEEVLEEQEERETVELEELSKSDIDNVQRLGTQLTAVRDELSRAATKEDIERIRRAVSSLGAEVVHFEDAERNIERHIKDLEKFISKELRFEGKSKGEVRKLAQEIVAELRSKKKKAEMGTVEERLTEMLSRSTAELKEIEGAVHNDIVNLRAVQQNLDSIAREMNVEFKAFLGELDKVRNLQITVENKNPSFALLHRLINNTARASTTFQQRLNYIHDAEKAEQRKKEVLNAIKLGFLRLKGFEKKELAEEREDVKAAKKGRTRTGRELTSRELEGRRAEQIRA